MFKLNGTPLGLDTPFTTEDGTQYPSNWLRLASAEEKAAIGITEEADAPSYDDRFYWGVDNPKQLDDLEFTDTEGKTYTQKGLKSEWVAKIKYTAGNLMAPTDWMVLRQLFKGIGMSSHVENYRDAVVAASNQFEAQISACTTVDELAALQFVWPNQSDF